MKNPFYITDELTLSRTEIVTTNHEELLKKIQKTMSVLGLKHRRIGANKMYFSQSSFTLGLGQNTAIKSVTVTLLFTEDTIQIHFKTSLNTLIILGFISILIFLLPFQKFIPNYIFYIIPIPFLIAYTGIKIALGNMRHSIKEFLMK